MARRYYFLVRAEDDSRIDRSSYRMTKIWIWGKSWEHAKYKAEKYVANLNRKQYGSDRTHYTLVLKKPHFRRYFKPWRYQKPATSYLESKTSYSKKIYNSFLRLVTILLVIFVIGLFLAPHTLLGLLGINIGVGFNFDSILSAIPSVGKIGKPEINTSQLEQEIFVLVNQERTSRGLTPLSWNSKIADVGRNYCSYLASTSTYTGLKEVLPKLSHTADGRSSDERLKASSLVYPMSSENLVPVTAVSSWYSEGSPAGYRSQSDIASEAVSAWMHSTEGHRENILNPLWQETGVAIAVDSTGSNFIIAQEFVSSNCPSGQHLCNGQCWLGCSSGTWHCTAQGGICS